MAVGWEGFPVAGMGVVVVAFVRAATVDAVDVAAAALAGGRGDASCPLRLTTLDFVLFIAWWGHK
jgi:hypothetical protein